VRRAEQLPEPAAEAEPESPADSPEEPEESDELGDLKEPEAPAALSFEELADAKPETTAAKPHVPSRTKKDNKPVIVTISTIAATIAVAGAVYYVFSAKAPMETGTPLGLVESEPSAGDKTDLQVKAESTAEGNPEPVVESESIEPHATSFTVD
jgi:hypothetical protein